MEPDRKRILLGRLVKLFALLAVAGFTAPLLLSLTPSDRADALGGPVRVDISGLTLDAPIETIWRGQLVHIIARTEEEVALLKSNHPWGFFPYQRWPGFDPYLRSVRDDVFVFVSSCPHKTCYVMLAGSPNVDPSLLGYEADRVLMDACHPWYFDLAGRHIGEWLPDSERDSRISSWERHLWVPEYRFLGPNEIEIGRK